MEPKVIADIVIHEKSDEDRNRVAQSIHEQLCGKQSYIDNAIILNIDEPKTIESRYSMTARTLEKSTFDNN